MGWVSHFGNTWLRTVQSDAASLLEREREGERERERERDKIR